MKLSVVIAHADALANAFVVWRGFEQSMRKAAEMGYDGVELALRHPDEIDRATLRTWLTETGLEVSCVSTGQVFASLGVSLTDPDPKARMTSKEMFAQFIDLASEFGQKVNIGRIRGEIASRDREEVERLFVEATRDLCTYASERDVTLVLEPVNRYETDFVNTVPEGVALLGKVGMPNLKLMPDVFHMNIEDVTIDGELSRYINDIAYVHFADSNRQAPGRGHTDFKSIVNQLKQAGYEGWVALEILPIPDPDEAAREAIEYLTPILREAYAGSTVKDLHAPAEKATEERQA